MTTIPRTRLLIGATTLWLIAAHATASQFYNATDLIDPNLQSIGGLSYDGSIVVGTNFIRPHIHDPKHGRVAFRWSRDSGQLELLGKPSVEAILGDFSNLNVDPDTWFWGSSARGVSDDGTVVLVNGQVGFDLLPKGRARVDDAFLWTRDSGFVISGALPGFNSVRPGVMSADGRVVTETSELLNPNVLGDEPPFVMESGPFKTAYRWTEEDGMQELPMLDGATDMWTKAISADGSVIVGNATGDAAWTSLRAFRWTTGDTAVEPFLD